MHLVVKDVDGERYTSVDTTAQQLEDLIYNIRAGATMAVIQTDDGMHYFVVSNLISFKVVK